MAKDVILTADLGGKLLTGEELAAIPDFAGIRKEIWDKFPGAIARKQYRAGEILMREGENGTTAFYILSGTIELFINNPVSHVESSRAKSGGGWRGLTKITNYIKGVPAARTARPAHRRTHIPIDASVDLPMDNPIAEVGAGRPDRRTGRPGRPQAGTPQASQVLSALRHRARQDRRRRSGDAAEHPEQCPVQRAGVQGEVQPKLPHAARSTATSAPCPCSAISSADFLNDLRDRVELVDVVPGQVICRQGEIADSFYLIRMGFVKVSQVFPGGELVLTYLSRGSYFGEMGLLPPVFRVRAKGLKPGTCRRGRRVRHAAHRGPRRPARPAGWRCPGTITSRASTPPCGWRASNCASRRLGSGKNPITFRMQPGGDRAGLARAKVS